MHDCMNASLFSLQKKSIFNVLGHGDDSPIPKIFWLAYAADQKTHVLWYSMYWIYIYIWMNDPYNGIYIYMYCDINIYQNHK